jgi:hypothetical protein
VSIFYWLLKTSTGKGKPEDILTSNTIDLLAAKLRTQWYGGAVRFQMGTVGVFGGTTCML